MPLIPDFVKSCKLASKHRVFGDCLCCFCVLASGVLCVVWSLLRVAWGRGGVGGGGGKGGGEG